MKEIKTKKEQNAQRGETGRLIPIESTMHLLLLGMLSIGFIGYFAMQKTFLGFIFAHVAALGIMGFYGCLAGAIAKKKGYYYWMAFQLGFFIPIILGGISSFLFLPEGERGLPLTCGGWVSLATGILVVISFFFIRKKK